MQASYTRTRPVSSPESEPALAGAGAPGGQPMSTESYVRLALYGALSAVAAHWISKQLKAP